MEEIKKKFDILNERKKDPKINGNEKDKINEELKKNKQLCQNIILNISKENSFFNKIFSLESILKSSEIKANISIAICCITTFGTGFIPVPFVDIPLVYSQQAIMLLCIALSYGFSIDEIPFKAAIGAAFGISYGLGGIVENTTLISAQGGGKIIIEKTITETGGKVVNKAIEVTAKKSLEIAGKKASEKIGIKLVEEGGKQIQELLLKSSIKEGGAKITSKITEKAVEYGSGIVTKKIYSEIIKEGGEIVTKEIGKQITKETGEEIGKMTTSSITKEIAKELMKNSGKTTATETFAESSKIIPIIGTIIGGIISGSINLGSTIEIGLAVRKFFKYLVCLTEGASYILNKKRIIDEIFNYIERVINNEINQAKIEYIEG